MKERKHGGSREGSGRKPKCLCGNCNLCKHKGSAYRRRFDLEPEDDLEQKLIQKFKEKGWD
jgi:hypothetical protein